MSSTNSSTGNTGEFTPIPGQAKIDTRVVKKMVGEALAKIDGILDAKGGFSDILKSDDDPTRGINVNVTEDGEASVNAKIIAETGKNIPNMVNAATAAITETLQNTAGLKVKDICIEVTDTMTAEEFKNQSMGDVVYPVV